AAWAGQPSRPSHNEFSGDLSILCCARANRAVYKPSQRAHTMGRAFVFLGPGWLLVGRCTGLCFGALDRFLEHGVDRYCTFPCRTAVVATAFIPFRSVLQRADAITGMKSDDGSPTTAGRQSSGYR